VEETKEGEGWDKYVEDGDNLFIEEELFNRVESGWIPEFGFGSE